MTKIMPTNLTTEIGKEASVKAHLMDQTLVTRINKTMHKTNSKKLVTRLRLMTIIVMLLALLLI